MPNDLQLPSGGWPVCSNVKFSSSAFASTAVSTHILYSQPPGFSVLKYLTSSTTSQTFSFPPFSCLSKYHSDTPELILNQRAATTISSIPSSTETCLELPGAFIMRCVPCQLVYNYCSPKTTEIFEGSVELFNHVDLSVVSLACLNCNHNLETQLFH